MGRIDTCLHLLTDHLRITPAAREQIRDELRQHIEESRQEFLARGCTADEAERLAVERLGDLGELRHHFQMVHHSTLTRYLVDLFTQEKHLMRTIILRTMDWSAIIAILLITVINAVVCSIFLLPKVAHLMHQAEQVSPMVVTVGQALTEAICGYWWLWTLALLGAGATVLFLPALHRLREPLLKTGTTLICLALVVWMTLCLWAVIVGTSTLMAAYQERTAAG